MKQTRIFKRNEDVFSDSLGVCRVAEVSTLNGNSNTYQYYKLESVFNNAKFCYIPTVGHQMNLRELMSADECQKLQGSPEFINLSDLQKQEVEYVLSNK